MDWRDRGTVLSVRAHGETSVILEVFTPARGRQTGVVRGGVSRKVAPHLQPGNVLDLAWRARLEDHIGAFTIEPVRSRAVILTDRLGLLGLNAVCALLRFTLAERDPHPDLFLRSEALLDRIAADPGWPADYLRWELQLLEEMGYGLDLGRCAVTGARDDLAYVSPRSGRAVSRAGAGDWASRLLPLPDVMLSSQGMGPPGEVSDGLRTTGYFLENRLAPALGSRPLPAARQRLIEALARQGRA